MFDPNLDTKTTGLSYHHHWANRKIQSFISLSAGVGKKVCNDHVIMVNRAREWIERNEKKTKAKKKLLSIIINTKSDCLLSLLKGHLGLKVMGE